MRNGRWGVKHRTRGRDSRWKVTGLVDGQVENRGSKVVGVVYNVQKEAAKGTG